MNTYGGGDGIGGTIMMAMAVGLVILSIGIYGVYQSTDMLDHGATWWSDSLVYSAGASSSGIFRFAARSADAVGRVFAATNEFAGICWILLALIYLSITVYHRIYGTEPRETVSVICGISAVLSVCCGILFIAGISGEITEYTIALYVAAAALLNAANMYFAIDTYVFARPITNLYRIMRGKSIIDIDAPNANKFGGILIGEKDDQLLPRIIRRFAAPAIERLDSGEEIRLPYENLANGICVVGAKNAGKSRTLFQIIEQVRARWPDIITIVVDKKGGEFCNRYYDEERDLILAPHDRRSAWWDIMADFVRWPQLINVAVMAALESRMSSHGDNKIWHSASLRIIGSICKRIVAKGAITNAADEIARSLRNYKEEAEDNNNKTAQSKYETLVEGIGDLIRWCLPPANAKTAYGIDELLKRTGFLFLIDPPDGTAEQQGSMNVLLACLLRRALSGPDTDALHPRVLFVIDEINTINMEQSLETSLYATARSKGIIIVTAGQVIPDDQAERKVQWWSQSEYRIVMKLIDEGSRRRATAAIGKQLYDEKTISNSTFGFISGMRNTTQLQERYHSAFEENYWHRLQPREFVLICNTICTGRAIEVPIVQSVAGGNCGQMQYDIRTDVLDWQDKLDGKGRIHAGVGAGTNDSTEEDNNETDRAD